MERNRARQRWLLAAVTALLAVVLADGAALVGTFTYGHDDEGRIDYIDGPAGALTYTYDAATGLRTQVVGPHTATKYAYDDLGRIAAVTAGTVSGGIVTWDATPTVYTYTPTEQIDRLTRDNGVVSQHQYDQLDRLKVLTHTTDAAVVRGYFEYEYYDDGRLRRAINDYSGFATPDDAVTVDYVYDPLGRLARETRSPGSTATGKTAYDDAYVYDLAGNRLSHTRTQAGLVTRRSTYTYNVMDQLTQQVVYAGGSSQTTTFGYNALGSMTSQAVSGGASYSYVYSADQRLRSISAGGTTVGFTYDPDGLRISRSVNDVVQRKYLLDALNPTGYAQVIAERDGSDVLKRSWLIGHAVLGHADHSGGGVSERALLRDAHGSVRVVADSAVLDRYDYDAYGQGLDYELADPNPASPLQYAGEWRDAGIAGAEVATSFDYLRARWYAPGLGRFNRIDPFAGDIPNPLTLHKYGYAHGDPINGRDPSGMVTLTEQLAKVSIIPILANIGLEAALIGRERATGRNHSAHEVSVRLAISTLTAIGGAAVGLYFASFVNRLASLTLRGAIGVGAIGGASAALVSQLVDEARRWIVDGEPIIFWDSAGRIGFAVCLGFVAGGMMAGVGYYATGPRLVGAKFDNIPSNVQPTRVSMITVSQLESALSRGGVRFSLAVAAGVAEARVLQLWDEKRK